MPKDILSEITERRKADIASKGFSLGYEIPQKRSRPIVPFLHKTGTILEVKRASPSKGDIAPALNAPLAALSYVQAGTAAISVLTEEHYFKGSLKDLIDVAESVGDTASVLRKDFLIYPEEIDVAYNCGADAVLLIARILPLPLLLQMAERAFLLGISVFLEIREDGDCQKAYETLLLAKEKEAENQLVFGINSRDLSDFRVDLLVPLKKRERLIRLFAQKDSSLVFPGVVAESGILNEDAAFFAGNAGFRGVLIGEAAAKSPESAKKLVDAFLKGSEEPPYHSLFWKKLSALLEEKEALNKSRNSPLPLVKICGITNEEDALLSARAGADILGFVLYPKSPRCVSETAVQKIKEALCKNCKKMPLLVCVITDFSKEEKEIALRLLSQGIIDGVQYHGMKTCSLTGGYAAVRVQSEKEVDEFESLIKNGAHRVLLDAYCSDLPGGNGVQIEDELVKKASLVAPLWLAGGINGKNVLEIIKKYKPELIDVASGTESSPGKKSAEKIQELFKNVQ